MTQSINIANGQGLTQGLKAYVEQLKKDGKIDGEVNITKAQWETTIHDLQNINDSRLKDSKNSVFTGGNGTDWTKNMIVKKGTKEFSETEFKTLLADMGVKLNAKGTAKAGTEASKGDSQAESFDNWVQKNTQKEQAHLQEYKEILKKDPNAKYTDSEALKEEFKFNEAEAYNKAIKSKNTAEIEKIYKESIVKVSADYVKLYDTNKDGVIDFEEYKAKEIADYQKLHPEEKIDPSNPTYTEALKVSFDNLNQDGDKGISPKEEAALFDRYARNSDTGVRSTKIRMYDQKGMSALVGNPDSDKQKSAKAVLKSSYELLFGTK